MLGHITSNDLALLNSEELFLLQKEQSIDTSEGPSIAINTGPPAEQEIAQNDSILLSQSNTPTNNLNTQNNLINTPEHIANSSQSIGNSNILWIATGFVLAIAYTFWRSKKKGR